MTGRRRSVPVLVPLAALGVGALLFGVTSLRAWSLHAGAFDLGFFVHGLATVATDGPLTTIPMIGTSFLGDHLSLTVLPFAPLALLSGAPYWLLAVQAVAVAAAIVPIWAAAGAAGLGSRRSWLLALSLVLAPAVAFAVWNDFHPSVLALPFGAVMVLGVTTRSNALMWLGGMGAALAREDVAVTVAALALYAWVRNRDRQALLLAVVSGVVGVGYIVLGGGSGWLGTAGLEYLSVPTSWTGRISEMASTVWDDGGLVLLFVTWLVPWAFFGRIAAGPWIAYVLSVLPFLVLDVPNLHSAGLHYYLFAGLVGAWSVLDAPRDAVVPLGVPVLGLTFGLVLGPFGLGLVEGHVSSLPSVAESAMADAEGIRDAHALMKDLPGEASVSAASPLVPFVPTGGDVWVWPSPFAAVVLPEIADLPIVEADPAACPDHVVAAVSPRAGFGPPLSEVEMPSGYQITGPAGDLSLLASDGCPS